MSVDIGIDLGTAQCARVCARQRRCLKGTLCGRL